MSWNEDSPTSVNGPTLYRELSYLAFVKLDPAERNIA